VFAGEPSGDQHAARFVDQWRRRHPNCAIRGVTGPELRAQGVETVASMETFCVMGFVDVFKALPRLVYQFHKLRKVILDFQPDAVLLVDYPEFNIRLARSLRKHGYQGAIIQYICPTVWAWGKGRIPIMEQYIDQVLCIFPFEVEFLSNTRLNTVFIGNPVADGIACHSYETHRLAEYGLNPHEPVLALLPGSRRTEVRLCLPKMLDAALRMHRRNPKIQITYSIANAHVAETIQEVLEAHPELNAPCLRAIPGDLRYELMAAAHGAIAVSGTVCLELALHGVPSVVVYDVKGLNRFIAQYIAKLNLEFYCNVNILAHREIFPERIAIHFNTEAVYATLQELWQDGPRRTQCVEGCAQIREMMMGDEASERATEAVEDLLLAQVGQG
ncbi:MAG: lipid-A-disaccharide synthase, partial [Chlamydiia bacterium]|nr:lipid-A-disaccharide synthase [Chlamydiia bacterium]